MDNFIYDRGCLENFVIFGLYKKIMNSDITNQYLNLPIFSPYLDVHGHERYFQGRSDLQGHSYFQGHSYSR